MSEARIAAIIHYVETSAFDIDPEAIEMMRLELTEAARATSPGSGTVQ
jgi:hypothetical protein